SGQRRERVRRAHRARPRAPDAPIANAPKTGEGKNEGIESWWPPAPGDRLHYPTLHAAGGIRVRRVQALLHVVGVFFHDGETHAVVAEWLPGRQRWLYEVYAKWRAEDLRLRPDSRSPRSPRPSSPRNKPRRRTP